jgi:hypothetical protein
VGSVDLGVYVLNYKMCTYENKKFAHAKIKMCTCENKMCACENKKMCTCES